MTNSLFILGDGDNIRLRIERLLFSGEFAALGVFSRNLSDAIQKVAKEISLGMSANVIFVGGDDVFVELRIENFDEAKLQAILANFHANTGTSISFGCGSTVETAYLNLRRAKSNGGNCIVANEFGDRSDTPTSVDVTGADSRSSP